MKLYEGMDELSLAAAYDTYALSSSLFSVAASGAVITTRRGLHVLPRRTSEEWSASGAMMLPDGTDDARFPFDAALEDVARRQNLPTAEFAAKRLEYRAVPALQGRGWLGVATLYRPLLLGLLGLVLALGMKRVIRGRLGALPA